MSAEFHSYSDKKNDNRNRIFNLIREAGSISKPGVSRSLGLSLPTVIQHINELEELGCIKEGDSIGQTGGRRAKSYCVNEGYRYSIGLYIFSDKIIITAADFVGDMYQIDTIKCPFQMDNCYYMRLGGILEEYIKRWNIDSEKILGIGIAVPGLTEDGERVYYGKTQQLNITGMSVQELGKYVSYPCRLYNEADAAGIAECMQEEENIDTFYINLGENVGGAVLMNGKLYAGPGKKAGKVGHIMMVPEGRKCFCGRSGCLNTVCGAEVLRMACGGEVKDFFRKLEDGDADCVKVWDRYLHYLAEAIVDLRMLFDCQIIVGGGITEYMEPYFDELMKRAVKIDTFDNPTGYLKWGRIKIGAAAYGAALPFIHELWQSV